MAWYIVRRLAWAVPILVGITLVSFGMIHMAPGGPIGAGTDMNPKATAESRARLQAYYGLDQPLHVQYGRWLGRLATLDFGVSFSPDGRPVAEKIKERIPITLTINVLSMGLIFLVAIPVGVYSAVRKGSLFDRISPVAVFTGFPHPTLGLALLMMILFGVKLGWLPISGISSLDDESLGTLGKVADRWRHLVLPVLLAGFGGLAGMSRYMRSNML